MQGIVLESIKSFYGIPKGESALNLSLMKILDEGYMPYLYRNVIKTGVYLKELGYAVNVKRIKWLLRLIGLMAIYPKKNLSKANLAYKKYPYLLKDLELFTTIKCGQQTSPTLGFRRALCTW